MQAFFKRHPEVAERMGQSLGRETAVVTKESLAEWSQQMKQYLDAMDPILLTSPGRIFNADESGFSVSPKTNPPPPPPKKKKKISSRTGDNHVYSTRNSTRHQVAVLACSSAVGQYIPSLLIFPYTRNPRFNALEGSEDALFKKKNQTNKKNTQPQNKTKQQQQQQQNSMDGLPRRSFSAS